MHRLKARAPLGAHIPREDQIGVVHIKEDTGHAMASLAMRRGQEAAFQVAAHKLWGVGDLPASGKWHVLGDYALIGAAPQQWFVSASFDNHEEIAPHLKAAFGDTASVTEQSDGWARFAISGTGLARLFERLCAVDVEAMQADQATRTIIEHLGCYLICHAVGTHYEVLVPRSSAASLHHALCATAHSIA